MEFLALGRQRQDGYAFKASLGYTGYKVWLIKDIKPLKKLEKKFFFVCQIFVEHSS